MRLLIAGGGTGGDLYPALAVARAFRAEEPSGAVLLVGRKGGPEERLVPAAGFELETVRVRGLDRDAPWKNLALPVLVPLALRAALRIVDRFRPDVVLGMGGYVMAPAVAAARIRRLPYVLHEKDVRPGLATRYFAANAAAVCTTLPGTESRLRGVRVVMTGVPLREGFQPRTPDVPPRRLLVTGGSQGARRLNQAVWSALDGLCQRFEEVVHVAGQQGADGLPQHARDRYRGIAFTDDMAALMARADLIVGRAGVGTIAEAAAVGLPMVLVPGTFGGGHQAENAAAMVSAGAAVTIPEHVLGQDLLVYSGAIKKSPELDAARAMGVKVLSRAEMLAQMINDADSIAVAGTAGKTTVTHMVGHILVIAGYDPTVLVGDGSSTRAGKTEWLVAETDESDGTLTLHHPQRAIVTNIELDHPDHFRDVSAVRDLFQWFIEAIPETGLAVLCADDELARQLKPRARKVTYGFRQGATYRCAPTRPCPVYRGADLLGHIDLRQPGRHNIQNATGAAAVALEIGVPFGDVAGALQTFPGAHRRMEFLGTFQGAAVYDDYAHHPTKVRATIEAARELRHRRLLVVFQPHRYSRLSALMHDFARSFEGADRVYVLDVYSAGEDNVSGVQAADLAHQVPQAIYVGDFTRAKEALKEIVGPDDLVLLMGAGDIKKLGDELAHKV